MDRGPKCETKSFRSVTQTNIFTILRLAKVSYAGYKEY